MGEVRIPVWDASEATVLRVLEELRKSIPTPVLNAVFEDLEEVLGPDSVPDEDDVPVLTLRMRGHLMRLIGALPEHEPPPQDVDVLITRARALLDVDVPGDYLGIRVHLRRMALAALDFLDHYAPMPVPTP
ncbi:hypothetical protein GCM10010371_67400 [Streptomyces subrutilus]|uniref:Uncharacterized protein n=1 Tax=Streptomyces subrutilus TaxID=36818 RepID=A0A5P2USY1_9ACTN|nr:DUF6415 family natural product biosynthesis protein [Streptomyces subrutilus]QEU82288.1 hypothetical protein CP968_32040 [Streptomyces subrutilus]GGZ98177.1 hypothetical protein GCM10010371_67400 [Streptomyces subrutilus]